MNYKKLGLAVLVSMAVLAAAGCGGNKAAAPQNADKKEITIACAETTQDLVAAVVPVMAEKGYKVTYKTFDNNKNTLVAANDGSVDAVMVVHKPFMESFNEANKGDLVMVKPYLYAVGMGLYSEKYKSVNELPNGATIALMNDAMNMDRALRILSDAGLITLKDNTGKASVLDIAQNPHNFKFKDMDQTQTVRALPDVDASISFFSHMKNANKDFKGYLVRDQHPENYPQGVVVKAGNADAKWVADLVSAFRDERVRKFAQEHYGGLYEYFKQ
ncbi:MetQ/NlpA family ABC transporter substrate-binding protein [Anaerospora hongkongensis]|uniref:MetQ/NlpA family ABC transporter substrate-binding protein n=1 Tax=Anaerospora hongkongensis TaxID=244830 RepID=UPI00289C6FB1|nr:MetQ/NlpA family ABC transporter substrate-binding protein [Anaerospora hongkongensis]